MTNYAQIAKDVEAMRLHHPRDRSGHLALSARETASLLGLEYGEARARFLAAYWLGGEKHPAIRAVRRAAGLADQIPCPVCDHGGRHPPCIRGVCPPRREAAARAAREAALAIEF
jgi:hypothetical protein